MTDTPHPLPAGAWIRTRVLASDSGPFNDRRAPAGSIGRVESVGPGPTYAVAFWPSGVRNAWPAADVDRDAVVLPPGHPDIPSAAALDLARAVADLAEDGTLDAAGGHVEAPPAIAARIAAAAPLHGARVRALVPAPDAGGGLSMPVESYNRLAALLGVGDRLPDGPFPTP